MPLLPDDRPGFTPPRPGQVLRLVLPSFVASGALAVAGLVLALAGHRTVGLVLVAVAAVGGLAMRAVLVYRAQLRNRPPDI